MWRRLGIGGWLRLGLKQRDVRVLSFMHCLTGHEMQTLLEPRCLLRTIDVILHISSFVTGHRFWWCCGIPVHGMLML